MTEYEEIADPVLAARTRARYAGEIKALEGLGFEYLAGCLESQGPFSALLQLPVLLLMLPRKELLVFPPPLRLAIANPVLRHKSPPTLALCMGMGVKFYSAFEDAGLLISSTFRSYAVPGPGSTILKPEPAVTIEAAWGNHRAAVAGLQPARGGVRDVCTFGGYVQLSRQEEDRSQYR